MIYCSGKQISTNSFGFLELYLEFVFDFPVNPDILYKDKTLGFHIDDLKYRKTPQIFASDIKSNKDLSLYQNEYTIEIVISPLLEENVNLIEEKIKNRIIELGNKQETKLLGVDILLDSIKKRDKKSVEKPIKNKSKLNRTIYLDSDL